MKKFWTTARHLLPRAHGIEQRSFGRKAEQGGKLQRRSGKLGGTRARFKWSLAQITGRRMMDIGRLTWGDVPPSLKYIRVGDSKQPGAPSLGRYTPCDRDPRLLLPERGSAFRWPLRLPPHDAAAAVAARAAEGAASFSSVQQPSSSPRAVSSSVRQRPVVASSSSVQQPTTTPRAASSSVQQPSNSLKQPSGSQATSLIPCPQLGIKVVTLMYGNRAPSRGYRYDVL